jgi:hypothetical protein
MRDVIFADPQLIAEPCRAVGVSDEDWHAWAREYPVSGLDYLVIYTIWQRLPPGLNVM